MAADSDDSLARQAARITAHLSALGELKREVRLEFSRARIGRCSHGATSA